MYPEDYTITEKEYNLVDISFSINIEETEDGFFYDRSTITVGKDSLETVFKNNIKFYREVAVKMFQEKQKKEKAIILKSQLASGDYKIIKGYEASLVGELMFYGFVSLIEE